MYFEYLVFLLIRTWEESEEILSKPSVKSVLDVVMKLSFLSKDLKDIVYLTVNIYWFSCS